MTKAIQPKDIHSTDDQVLYMAMELSKRTWKIVFKRGGWKTTRMVNVEGGEHKELRGEIVKARKKFELPEGCKVKSCYEAGRDGFWLHRYLESIGVENVVVDAASIEIQRRARRKKTDRLDAHHLLMKLIDYGRGNTKAWSVVRVPSEQEEDERRVNRELERLKKERTGHINRIKAMLMAQGIRIEKMGCLSPKGMDRLRLWNGKRVPEKLRGELKRELERLDQVERQLVHAVQELALEVKEKATKQMVMVEHLMNLKGIGLMTAVVLVTEFFGWRTFRNRREVAALAGLTGTPYDSGDTKRDQGISKAGNKWVRTIMIELAWRWIRYQPQSVLTLWFERRFAKGGKRMRRIGIVAVARKLLVALWKYVAWGEVPEGSLMTWEKAA
jgi:transposase